jgi:hypothetical protein
VENASQWGSNALTQTRLEHWPEHTLWLVPVTFWDHLPRVNAPDQLDIARMGLRPVFVPDPDRFGF